MPLWLEDPRKDKTPYYRVRGTYLGIKVDRSTETDRRAAANRILRTWREQIERGEYRDQAPADDTRPGGVTFIDAVIAYMQAGGERKRLGPIIEMTGEFALRDVPIAEIDQVMIDNAAAALFPGVPAPTLNREFYTPVAAVLHRADPGWGKVARPKGWRGSRATAWLEPLQLFAVLDEAEKLDPEFGCYLHVLPYTGLRLRESLRPRLRDLDIGRQTLYLGRTKTDAPRMAYLPMHVCVALANHPRGLDRAPDERIFRFHAGGHMYDLLHAALARAGATKPRRQNGFHLFCHTYGTWMHRYGDLDAYGLTETGRWADPSSAHRYVHLEVSEEARRADRLPAPGRKTR